MPLTLSLIENIETVFMKRYDCSCGYHYSQYCPEHGKFEDINIVIRNTFEEFFELLKEAFK